MVISVVGRGLLAVGIWGRSIREIAVLGDASFNLSDVPAPWAPGGQPGHEMPARFE
jgi:hypothetical protein